jgi:hypothetical protein
MAVDGNKVMMSLDPGRLGLHPTTAAATDGPKKTPELTDAQKEALKVLTEVAKKHGVALNLQKGDILFINNWTTLHGRDAFDASAAEARRHFVRLWLSNPAMEGAIPAAMKIPRDAAFGYLEKETSGNIVTHHGRLIEPKCQVYPQKEYQIPKYTAGSAAFVMDD